MFDLLLCVLSSYCIYHLVYRLNSHLIFPSLSCCIYVFYLLAGLVFSLLSIRSIRFFYTSRSSFPNHRHPLLILSCTTWHHLAACPRDSCLNTSLTAPTTVSSPATLITLTFRFQVLHHHVITDHLPQRLDLIFSVHCIRCCSTSFIYLAATFMILWHIMITL